MSPEFPPDTILLRALDGDGGRRARALVRAADRGELVRLAHGTYCRTRTWLALAPWDRYRLAAVAHARSRRTPVVFCAESALILHGLPMAWTPDVLQVRATSRGQSRRRYPPLPYVNQAAALDLQLELTEQGHTVGTGVLPVLPAVQGRWNLLGGGGAPCQVTVSTSDGAVVGNVLVDELSSAVAVVLGTASLADSLPAADALKRTHPRADQMAASSRNLLPSEAARDRFDHTWGFADGLAESAGESLSRALVHELGFVVPVLQHKIRDAHGRLVARTDCWWEEIRLAGEFDGLAKYSGRYDDPADAGGPGAAAPGRSVVVKEKRREDEIRRLGVGVMRWVWADLQSRHRFAALLAEHGVPRRR